MISYRATLTRSTRSNEPLTMPLTREEEGITVVLDDESVFQWGIVIHLAELRMVLLDEYAWRRGGRRSAAQQYERTRQ